MMRPRRASAMVAGGLILLESLPNDRAREVPQFERMLMWSNDAQPGGAGDLGSLPNFLLTCSRAVQSPPQIHEDAAGTSPGRVVRMTGIEHPWRHKVQSRRRCRSPPKHLGDHTGPSAVRPSESGRQNTEPPYRLPHPRL